jgi:hypothetical protein
MLAGDASGGMLNRLRQLGDAVTDDDGRFTIENMPAGELNLNIRKLDSTGRGWMTQFQQRVTVTPGADAQLGNIEQAELPAGIANGKSLKWRKGVWDLPSLRFGETPRRS